MVFYLVSCSGCSRFQAAASRWSDPSLPLWSPGGWFWGRGQRTRLNEFPAKCQRSQGRAPRQRMARQSMHPLASSIPIRGSLWKPRKLQVSPLHSFQLFYCTRNCFYLSFTLVYGQMNDSSFHCYGLSHPPSDWILNIFLLCSQWLPDMGSKVWAKLLPAGACPLQLTCPAWRQRTKETTPTSTLSPKTAVAGRHAPRAGTRGAFSLAVTGFHSVVLLFSKSKARVGCRLSSTSRFWSGLFCVMFNRQQETPPPQSKPAVVQPQELPVGGSRSWANSKQPQLDGKSAALHSASLIIGPTGQVAALNLSPGRIKSYCFSVRPH